MPTLSERITTATIALEAGVTNLLSAVATTLGYRNDAASSATAAAAAATAAAAYQARITFATVAAASAASVASFSTGDIAFIRSFAVDGDGGHGQFRLDKSSTATLTPGMVLAASGGGRWIRVFTGSINVRWFGARGDNTTDDTAALQACFDYCTLGTPGGVAFPIHISAGTYKLSSALTVWSAYSTHIYGDGPSASSLVQFTNGASVLFFSTVGAAFGQSQVILENFSSAYNGQQTSAHASKAWDCSGYQWTVRSCNFFNCYRGVYNLIDINGRNGVWGVSYRDMEFRNQTGCAIMYQYLPGGGDNAMPNCSINNVYIRGVTASPPTETGIQLWNWVGCSIQNVELNQWANAVISMQGSRGFLNAVRIENSGGVDLIPDGTRLFVFNSCRLLIGYIEAAVSKVASGNIIVVKNDSAGNDAHITINSIWLNSTMAAAGGNVYVLSNVKASVNQITGLGTNMFLYDGGGSADFDDIKYFPGEFSTTFPGNASINLTVDTPQSILFDTTLTADRFVELPNLSGNTRINGGQEWIITKTTTAGAGAVVLRNSSGVYLATIPAANIGVIRFRAIYTTWSIVGFYKGTAF